MTKKTRIPALSIVVATDYDGGFGKNGKIPWNIPDDMKHFKDITSGGVCIMGRKTYEDMLAMTRNRQTKVGSPPTYPEITDILPTRTSFVVTSDKEFTAHGATAVPSLRAAVEELDEKDDRQIYVIGGLRMYIEALSWADRIYLTIVKGETFGCDKFFPIEVINKHYKIIKADETDSLYFLTYRKG